MLIIPFKIIINFDNCSSSFMVCIDPYALMLCNRITFSWRGGASANTSVVIASPCAHVGFDNQLTAICLCRTFKVTINKTRNLKNFLFSRQTNLKSKA